MMSQSPRDSVRRESSAPDDIPPVMPSAKELKKPGALERQVSGLIQRVESRRCKRREGQHNELCEYHENAEAIRGDPSLFRRFLAIEAIVALKRKLRGPDDVLRALLQAANDSKLASAYWKRLEPLWKAKATTAEVREDLERNGIAGRKQTVTFAPCANSAHLLEGVQIGAKVGVLVYATLLKTGGFGECQILRVTGDAD